MFFFVIVYIFNRNVENILFNCIFSLVKYYFIDCSLNLFIRVNSFPDIFDIKEFIKEFKMEFISLIANTYVYRQVGKINYL